MGHRFEDEVVKKDKDVLPYEIKAGADGGVQVHLGDKDYRPEEISAMILSKLKADAEAKARREDHRGRSSPCRHISTIPSAQPPRQPGR